MSEEAVAVPVSKDNSLVQQTSTKSKNTESQKPKRKQEYTDITNWFIKQPSTPKQ